MDEDKKQEILSDLIDKYTDDIDNNKFYKLYCDAEDEEVEPDLTFMLYNGGLDPFADEQMQKIPDYFAYDLEGLSNLRLISNNVFKNVTEIGKRAFGNCSCVESVDFSGMVYESAFEHCSNLKNVKLGSIAVNNNRTYVYDEAFICCENLESVEIGPNVNDINDWAFAGCSKLNKFTITTSGNNSLYLGQSVFAYCKNLTELTIPNNDVCISRSTFNNSNIQTINLPKDYCYDSYIPKDITRNYF